MALQLEHLESANKALTREKESLQKIERKGGEDKL